MRFTVISGERFCVCEYANYHGSDAEGAGEMFKVTALPFDGTPRTEDGKVNYKEDFFGKETNLRFRDNWKEKLCDGFGSDLYFGPTFRAENSNTASPCRILDD
jgi:asparaginyl-tRNA synthetase